MNDIGRFPNRLKPITCRTDITDLPGFMEISDLYTQLSRLNMSIYSPMLYILVSKQEFYSDLYDTQLKKNLRFTQSQREKGLQSLMRVNLLKRLESSVDSFRKTLTKFVGGIAATIQRIDAFVDTGKDGYTEYKQPEDFDLDQNIDEWLDDDFSIGDNVKINLADMNTSGWKADLEWDLVIAQALLAEMKRVTPQHDSKLNELKSRIAAKLHNPTNPGNRKVLIFSAFADTVDYLYEYLAPYLKKQHNLESAKISG